LGSGYWLLAACNAVASALLINAGIAKLVAPARLLRAVAELAGVPGRDAGELLARGLGAAELAVAIALLVRPARLPAGVAVALLGLSFAGVGLLGVRRGSSVPCGCFGGAGRQPLGWANVGLGVLLAAAWPVNALTWRLPAHDYQAAVIGLASIATALSCLWLNRHLITPLFAARSRPGRGRPAGAQALNEVS
jgi:hypothetical protein